VTILTGPPLLTVTTNFIGDERVSLFDRGVLLTILSLGKRWTGTPSDLTDGKPGGPEWYNVWRALEQLAAAGYLSMPYDRRYPADFMPTEYLDIKTAGPQRRVAGRRPPGLPPELDDLAPLGPPVGPLPRQVRAKRRIPLQSTPLEVSPPRTATRNLKNRRTCVYRHFDADGTLLYVGITSSSSRRESGHLLNSLWHGMSASRTEEWFPNRADAEAAEVKAIKDEEPLFNIEGNASTRALLKVRRYLEARNLGALWEIHRRRVEFGQRPANTRKGTAKVLPVG
jgi:hypothetical protein